MENIKIEKLPKEVIEKAKIVGNIFKEKQEVYERFENAVCELLNVLKRKYKITDKQWNKDIAPILRKIYKK